VDHPTDQALQSLTLGKLTTANSLAVQKHIYNCPACLKRLVEAEMLLALADVEAPPHQLKPDVTKPLSVRHDTADGFIYSQVARRGDKWLERHWGGQLQGQDELPTMEQANGHALAAFAEMFPEHRCTERCCNDPVLPDRDFRDRA
jgi:hypothetical protein